MKILRYEYSQIGDDVPVAKEVTPSLSRGGLSVIFAIMCIVDLFGVFPVITLPKSVISCGVYGIPLVLAVIGLQLYTAVLLGRCWLLAQEITPLIREKNRFLAVPYLTLLFPLQTWGLLTISEFEWYPYAAIGELAFGKVGRRTVTILLNATVFGSGIPNFIIASQSLQMFWWKITGGEVNVTYCVWMLLLALLLCPVMWLGSPKDMKPIALSSVLIVTTVAVTTWTCISLDEESAPSTETILDYRPKVGDFLSAYGILAFQFDIHPMLLTIQVDMRDSRQINKAVTGGFFVTLFMFTVTAGLAARRYGMDTESNILQGIPPSIPLYIVVLLVTLQLCLSSAVGNSVLFQQIEDYFRIPRNFCWQRILIRTIIVFLAVFLAQSVPRFDLVMGLVGSTLTGPLMFVFPPIFFLKLCYLKSQLVKKDPLKFGKRITSNIPQIICPDESQNGRQNGYQDCDETTLILTDSSNKYRTFTNKYYRKIYGDTDDDYSIKWYDVMLALIVMSMGIAATVVATYSSWANSIQYASFSPPCLVNATIAARAFLQEPFNL